MSKKMIFLYFLCICLVGLAVGFAIGATEIVLFQSTSDGKYALVNICYVDSDYIDENNNCRNFTKTKVTLKEATYIGGRRWAGWGAAIGFMVGLGFIDLVDKRYKKYRQT